MFLTIALLSKQVKWLQLFCDVLHDANHSGMTKEHGTTDFMLIQFLDIHDDKITQVKEDWANYILNIT